MNIIIAITILLVYTIALCIKGGGVPSSLSASVFRLPEDRRWIWTVVIFSVCFLYVPTYIDRASGYAKVLAFLSIVGLAFVGAAPLVRSWEDRLQFKVHEVGAVVCAVCSQSVLAFNQPWLLFCWVPFVVLEIWRLIKKQSWRTQVFWAEMTCFANTFAFCLI